MGSDIWNLQFEIGNLIENWEMLDLQLRGFGSLPSTQ